MDSGLPDPSTFALSVAVGSAHVLGSLDRSSAPRSPAVAALLELLALVAYLAAATLAFAVRVAVACGDEALERAAAAILGWLANAVAKLLVALLIFSGLGAAVFCLLQSSAEVMRSPGVAQL